MAMERNPYSMCELWDSAVRIHSSVYVEDEFSKVKTIGNENCTVQFVR